MEIVQTNLTFRNMDWGNIPKAIILHNADASKCTVEDIHQWHLNKGWSGIGYHYFVRKDGTVYKGRPDNAVGSQCQGHNRNTLGICFEGCYMKETMPVEQFNAGVDLILYLFDKYSTMPIYGHKELFNTDCPGTKFPLDAFKILKREPVGEWHKGLSLGNEDKWWYKHPDGSYTENAWEKIDNNWYFFNSEGWMHTGWLKWSGDWYYCWSDGSMATGWNKIGGEWYYFKDKGAMAVGWLEDNRSHYYLETSGQMVHDTSLNLGGVVYRFDSAGRWVK